ncbi:MAG: argininosuccinate lyase [Spirochaetes bacterium]|uniref:Argininosuccinate lyase n=1 Tax=Candidatus Ornithospirochaeta stercoripullorum TaxID=2840899 RepID=A0A9D9H6P5_9SPIO|nr:argininosuccinate lyase [Candidatus Ornithospirochaeta stercoripullorum]
MAKLWQKNYTLDSMMEHFTVRNDYIYDEELVFSDLIGSAAQAKGLEKIGILTADETSSLLSGLQEIAELRKRDAFPITLSDEDCHTAIEGYLTRTLGEVGKKIHTGRSRNDQVQTALRIYMREASLKLSSATLKASSALIDLADKNRKTPMPGRTHMQIAMPSSVALWALSFAEELLEETGMMLSLYNVLDQSPLGSAASYGVTLPLDREYTASLMGFGKVQNNVLYANNSRGKFEAFFLDHAEYIALTLSKLAQDLILFTLPEFGYFSLPAELCTGSSIMPQKKNPDGLELARSRTALISSCSMRVKSIIKALPSGYNRDFQDTKEPLIEGYRSTEELVLIMAEMVEKIEVHEKALEKACVPELYATDRVMEKVLHGGNFRDSYKDVGLNLNAVQGEDPVASLEKRTSTGTTGNLGLENDRKWLSSLSKKIAEESEKLSSVYSSLVPGIEEVIPV